MSVINHLSQVADPKLQYFSTSFMVITRFQYLSVFIEILQSDLSESKLTVETDYMMTR